MSPQKRSRTTASDVEVPEVQPPMPVKGFPSPVSVPLNQYWPSSPDALSASRKFLIECAQAKERALIVPDKDADGLSAGCIIYRTLLLLGIPSDKIFVHLLDKGYNVHDEYERERMKAYDARYVVVLDQGSRPGPALVPGHNVKTLLVDHHESNVFPDNALVLSACAHEPVATSATLTYVLCEPLHKDVSSQCDYLCAIGTMGDLGTAFKWEEPFPDMKACFKKYTKKAIIEAVSLINAPRRTATYDVDTAWQAMLGSCSPSDIISPSSPHAQRLIAARREVNAEVERCTHTAPKWSGDGKVALLRIDSQAQIHPVIATRWAGYLKSSRLQIVMAANSGYTPGLTHFSCRVARSAKSVDPLPDIIALLKDYASREPGLREAMGDNFARGHKQASGGIVNTEEFERLWKVMLDSQPEVKAGEDVGGKATKRRKKESKEQKNTIDGWLDKK